MNVWLVTNGKKFVPSSSMTFFLVSCSQWPMANGQWPMANGQWTMANGQWSMVNGQWSMSMVNGQWSMVNVQPQLDINLNSRRSRDRY